MLHEMSRVGNAEMVQFLLEHNADPNGRSEFS